MRCNFPLPTTAGFVYFARAGDGPVKIGWSRDPHARSRHLRCPVSGTKVSIIACFAGTPSEEAFVHGALHHHRLPIRGGAAGNTEWFAPSAEVLAFAEHGLDMIAAIRGALLSLADDLRAVAAIAAAE